jgi:RNA polymerase sigma factor (sigma-70 family)
VNGTVDRRDRGSSTGSLLAAALDGDRDAWARLVDAHQDLLWWIARRHRLDENEAADVVQTVWLQLVRHGASIQDPDRLAGWLATTARREAWARVRKLDRQVPSEIVLDEPDPGAPAVDDRLLDLELQSEALVAFRRLGEPCQQLLRLLCTDPPLSYAEIAAMLGRTTGYIGPTRARCLDRLRQLMERTDDEQEGGHD